MFIGEGARVDADTCREKGLCQGEDFVGVGFVFAIFDGGGHVFFVGILFGGRGVGWCC